MDGYSEIDTIYFSVGDKTSYAKYVPKLIDELIETGTYQGSPPYRPVSKPLPKLLRQYHAAEHQVYNCFLDKIKQIDSKAKLNEFQNYIPRVEEAKHTNPFSILCGTTVCFSSGILLIAAAIPNILKLSSNTYFMIVWFAFIITITVIASYFIQKKFYLSKAEDRKR